MGKERHYIDPPKWADNFLQWYCANSMIEELQGDLYEAFHIRSERMSIRKARLHFILEVLLSFKLANIRGDEPYYYSNNTMVMTKNYIKIAIRNLMKYKFYSGLNILGLAIGMACTLLISLYILNERSYDKFHIDSDRIFRVTERVIVDGDVVENSASVPFPVGPTITIDYPDIDQTRLYHTFQKVPLLSTTDKQKAFYEDKLFFTDSTFFDVFSFKLIRGDKDLVLTSPSAIVLTQEMAFKYFGSDDPIGQTLVFENGKDFVVTGIAENPPPNSHFKFDFLASMEDIDGIFAATGNRFGANGWYWNPTHTYLKIPQRYIDQGFNEELVRFTDKNLPSGLKNLGQFIFEVQPLTDIHLKSDLYQEIEPNGSERSVFIALLIGVFILFIASINFINLTTARSFQRAKEVAVRKVLGSKRKQLIAQFYSEAILTSFLALLVAVGLAILILPVFEAVVSSTLNVSMLLTAEYITGIVVITLALGLLSGTYPSLVLSGFNPLQAFNVNRSSFTGQRSSWVRKGLIVFQFSISIVLIVSTIVVLRQHNFLLSKEMGFEKESVVMMPIRGTEIKAKYEEFKTELKKDSRVISASALSDIIGNDVPLRPFRFEGMEKSLNLPGLFVDHDFVNTFDLKLLEGRDFTRVGRDDTTSLIINQAALNLIDSITWEDQRVGWGSYRNIIGVSENFHYANLRQDIRPMVIIIDPNWYAYMAVRVQPGNIQESLASIENVWNEFEAERPFVPFFLDEKLNDLYQNEQLAGTMVGYFSVLAIFIAVLGLFGLSTFTTSQRTKEIGIRKILGASSRHILTLLSGNFAVLVLIANVIAWPAGWYFMDQWLQSYPYSTPMELWIFPITGVITIAMAILIVCMQSLRTILSNPTHSLRDE